MTTPSSKPRKKVRPSFDVGRVSATSQKTGWVYRTEAGESVASRPPEAVADAPTVSPTVPSVVPVEPIVTRVASAPPPAPTVPRSGGVYQRTLSAALRPLLLPFAFVAVCLPRRR